MSAMTQLDKKAKRTIMRILHTDMDTTGDALLELVTSKCPDYPRALVEEHIKGGLSAWNAPKGPSATVAKEQPYRIEARNTDWRDHTLVASRKIQVGEVVLAEKPLVTFDAAQLEQVRAKTDTLDATLSSDALTLLELLPISPKEAKNTQNVREAAIFSNLIPVELVGRILRGQHLGVYKSQLGMVVVHAMRDIEKGEIITFSRSSAYAPATERKTALSAAYGIEKCTCNLCSQSPSELATSDARSLEMRRIRDATTTTKDPWAQLNLLDTAFQLALEEGQLYLIPLFAEPAYQLAYVTGQLGRAKAWAQRYCDYYPIAYGRSDFSNLFHFGILAKKPEYWVRTPELQAAVAGWVGVTTDGSSSFPGEPVPRWIAQRILTRSARQSSDSVEALAEAVEYLVVQSQVGRGGRGRRGGGRGRGGRPPGTVTGTFTCPTSQATSFGVPYTPDIDPGYMRFLNAAMARGDDIVSTLVWIGPDGREVPTPSRSR